MNKYLLQETSIEKAYIPLNGRISLPEADCPLNENVIPCCPRNPSLPMNYLYPEKNLHAYPGTLRGTQEWDATYKIRVNVEKAINHFKDSFCVAGRKTQNEKTLHADLLLAGIAQLVTVMVADKIHKHQYIRSLKPLIA